MSQTIPRTPEPGSFPRHRLSWRAHLFGAVGLEGAQRVVQPVEERVADADAEQVVVADVERRLEGVLEPRRQLATHLQQLLHIQEDLADRRGTVRRRDGDVGRRRDAETERLGWSDADTGRWVDRETRDGQLRRLGMVRRSDR